MLPGLVAGHYSFADAHIDLGPLSRFAGARFYHDEATGLDLSGQRVLCQNRPPVPYDILSIDIGSTPDMAVPGAAEAVVAVKPIGNFIGRWEALVERVCASDRPLSIGAVGAGAGGTEMLLAMQHGLATKLKAFGRNCDRLSFHLFAAGDEPLATHGEPVRRAFVRVFGERGVTVHRNARAIRVDDRVLHTADGAVHELDEIVWVTRAGTQRWMAGAGLSADKDGFVEVNDTLESTSHPGVFAAGDCAAVLSHPREKAGVFAVRQGPPLERNLRRALRNKPLVPFTPQKQFLSLGQHR